MKRQRSKKGKLIVIEGTDGSGKTTQFKLLIKRLKEEGFKTSSMSFPRHNTPFFGLLIDRYLNNEFGKADEVSPYLASVLYAADRWEVRDKLMHSLKLGKIVVLDRYVESNLGHQGGKIQDVSKRKKLLKWLGDLDYKVFKNPKPDLVIYLSVPSKFSVRLAGKLSKKYKKTSYDGLENIGHLTKARKVFEALASSKQYWKKINCVERGKLFPILEIHEKVWEYVRKIIS
ncbi:MAG: Thymidylate kinase [uncultured bacterium]|nr:MAG: Thymidylate kinase [uncultured bacterium]